MIPPIHERFQFNAEKCILCGSNKELTHDHIPPQSLNNKGVYTLNTYPDSTETKTAKNGVSFRTICKKCNNEEIQNLENLFLIPIANELKRYLKFGKFHSSLSKPISLWVNPKKLSKLIVGKILIMSMVDYDSIQSGIENNDISYWGELWEFYHNINNHDLVFDLWIHDSFHINLFSLVSIVLDLDLYRDPILTSILSFYPIGFMVFKQKNKNIPNISKLNYNIDTQEINLSFSDSKTPFFPLDISPNNGILLTDRSSNIYARKIKSKF